VLLQHHLSQGTLYIFGVQCIKIMVFV